MSYVYGAVVLIGDHYHLLIPDFIKQDLIERFCVVDLGNDYEDYALHIPSILETYKVRTQITPIMVVRAIASKYLRKKALTLNNLVDIVQITIPRKSHI